MVDNSVPLATPKAQTLGRALKDERAKRKVTQDVVATALGINKSTISRIESGTYGAKPKSDMISRILGYLQVEADRYDEIMKLTEGTDAQQWLAVTPPEQRQHQDARIDLEEHAEKLVEVAPSLVPGLLQVREYARAIMMDGGVPAAEIGTRVATRMGRRDVLTGRTPPQLVALLDEAVLRHTFGGPGVMAAQLDFLVEMAERPHIDIRVVPFSRPCSQGLESMFTLIEPRKSEGTVPVVDVGGRTAGLIFHAPEVVAAYRESVDAVLRVAMSPTDSIRLIAAVAKEMRTG